MLVPKIIFNESNVGVSPIRTGIRNRIGIVGQFSRGPANVFNYINGFSDFASRYGSDLSKGSMAFQAAHDQGARDFGLVRVLGHGKVAYGSVLFNGIASKPNRLILNLKYVGPAAAKFRTLLNTPIFTSGSYNASINGRYHFYVSSIDNNVATIRFAFFNIDQYPQTNQPSSIDWNNWDSENNILLPTGTGASTNSDYAAPSSSFTVNLNNDNGVAKTHISLHGVTLRFGTSSQTGPIDLRVGNEWTIRVNSFSYITDIFKDALPNQVTSAFISSVQGLAPLGDVIANDANNGATFYLDNTDGSFLGKIGEGHSYYFELEEPDAIVKATGSYQGDTNDIKDTITIEGAIGSYIKLGARVSSTITGLVQNNTVVSAVTSSVTNGIINTTIILDKPLTPNPAADGSTTFTFSNASGLSVTPYLESGMQFFQGGIEGPRNAYVDFYSLSGTPLIRILAASPGSWGNNLRISVYPITQSQFRLVIKDLAAANYNPPIDTEEYIINLAASGQVSREGTITALDNSNLVRGVLLPVAANPNGYDATFLNTSPQRLAPADSTITEVTDLRHPSFYGPTKLTSVALENGFDGPALSEDDYIKALDQIREVPVHIILTPGVYEYPRLKAHLITVAESASELEGLRVAILNARPGLTPSAAKQETVGLDSKRAVMIAGWSTYSGQANAPRFSLSPDAVYAGKLATIPYHVSPAARTSAGTAIGINEVDIQRYNSLNSLQVYTDARLEVISLDSAQDGFYFTTGRTLSSSTSWDRIVIRRTYDIIRGDLFFNLQQYKSEPHTRLLRKQIASSINAYLGVMARNGRIANYLPAICDETNNPPESYTTGELNIQVSFLPLYAADIISITMVRNTSGGLQLGE